MEIKIEARNDASNSRGKVMLVRQAPDFNLERTSDGRLLMTIEVREEEQIGSLAGNSVRIIDRCATVTIEHDELRQLSSVLHRELFEIAIEQA